MQFLDTLTGYCGTANGLLKTTDGGKTWTNCLPKTSYYIIPYFFDANNGYCLESSRIMKTTDGGLNWTVSCQLPSGDAISGFHFIDMNTGWASTFRRICAEIEIKSRSVLFSQRLRQPFLVLLPEKLISVFFICGGTHRKVVTRIIFEPESGI